jgi:hypothetical protein
MLTYSPSRPRRDPRIIGLIAMRRLMCRVAMGLILAGCNASGTPPTVDGFTLGAYEACSPPVGSIDPKNLGSSCGGMIDLATAALDTSYPSHAAVVSIKRYGDGTQPGPIEMTGTGPPPTLAPRHPGPDVTVFVFTLADGSVRATGVVCPDSASCVVVSSYPN